MFDLFAIIGAIVFLLVVLQLRALLAMPIRSGTVRPSPVDLGPSLAASDIVGAAADELAPLGFTGPHWFLRTEDVPGVRGLAAFSHADGTHVFLVPQFSGEHANRCVVYAVSELVDGRRVVTQPGDPWFALTAAPGELVETVGPSSLADTVGAHRARAAAQGAVLPDDPSRRRFLAGDWFAERIEHLIRDGRARRGPDGIVRFRLATALKGLLAFWRRPKWPADPTPVPVARLTLIAQNQQRTREQAPVRKHQLALFTLSVALFLVLGGHFFGMAFAAVLVLVIGVHELGHFAAMRAFGYRNVHMLALPLVGGVTIGHEEHPNAQHRAWMSLMGPLPGILVGWFLVGVLVVRSPEHFADLTHPLTLAAWVFLFVNYLNILPFMPLDGGHIVQALLPPRWYAVRIALLASGAIAGIAFGLGFGFFGIALIAGLQLFAVPGLLQTRRAIADLESRGTSLVDLPPARALRLALEALERIAGPTAQVQGRVHQAEDIVRTMAVVPMSLSGRLLTGGVYAGLLVVPLLAIAVALFGLLGPGLLASASTPEAEALAEELVAEEQRIETQVAGMPMAQVLNSLDLAPDEPLPGPASPTDLVDATRRLGAALPEDLLQFYRQHDGHPAIGMLPIARITRIGEMTDDVLLLEGPDAVPVHVTTYRSGAATTVSPAHAKRWVHVGGFQSDDLLLLDLEAEPAVAGHRFINYFFESPTAYPDFTTFVKRQYADRRYSDAYDRLLERHVRDAEQRLLPEDEETLLDAMPGPNPIARLLRRDAEPAPADEARIAAATERLGKPLPDALLAAWRRKDGDMVLGLSPIDDVRRMEPEGRDAEALAALAHIRWYRHENGRPARRLERGTFAPTDCVVLSALEDDTTTHALNLLWCADAGDGEPGIIATRSARIYATARAFLVHRVAHARVSARP